MCNSVIISRLKALQKYRIVVEVLPGLKPDEQGWIIKEGDIKEIIDEFEVKDG